VRLHADPLEDAPDASQVVSFGEPQDKAGEAFIRKPQLQVQGQLLERQSPGVLHERRGRRWRRMLPRFLSEALAFDHYFWRATQILRLLTESA